MPFMGLLRGRVRNSLRRQLPLFLGAVEICQKSSQKDLLNLKVSVIESDFRKGISTIWMLDRPDSSLEICNGSRRGM